MVLIEEFSILDVPDNWSRNELISLSPAPYYFLLYYGDGENGLFLHRRKTENCAENKEVDELIL